MREVKEINSGSMADIAFLLLVFFLVTTNISQDYGIKTQISKPFGALDSLSLVQSTLLINGNGEYLLNDNKVTRAELSTQLAKEFDKRAMVKNVVLVRSDREVAFDNFLAAMDQSKKAFKIFYNDLANQKYAADYLDLADSLKVKLKQVHPVALAENVVE